jgi:hypothetical protein
MPDFDLHVYANPNLGYAGADWLDPRAVDGGGQPTGAPSRLNPRNGHPEKRYEVAVDEMCEIRAVVDGVEAPPDSALGGRLFFPGNVEYPPPPPMDPAYPPLHFTSEAGRTSVQYFTPRAPGHYLLYIRRPAGGQVMVHFDAVEGT